MDKLEKAKIKKELKKEIEAEVKEDLKLRAKKSAAKFKSEFNKSINTAISAAFGFLVALVWKDVITEWVDRIAALSPLQGKVISALLITLIGTLGILITARIFSTEESK